MPAAYLLDTNLLIYYINGQLSEEIKLVIDEAILSGSSISVITRIEVMGWKGHDEDSLNKTRTLLEKLHEIPLINEIADRCILLRSRYKIKLPDALIAATALCTNLPLLTRNTEDFQMIDGLTIFNPFISTSAD